MNAIEKFRTFLEQELSSFQKEVLLNKEVFIDTKPNYEERDSILKALDHKIEQLQSDERKEYINCVFARLSTFKNFLRLVNSTTLQQTFHDFKNLCFFLERTGFSELDGIEIVLFFVENNLRIMDHTEEIDTIPPFRFTFVTLGEIAEFLDLDDKEIEKAQKKNDEMSICGTKLKIDKSFIPMSLLSSTHKTIQNCYLKKRDTYTESDIKKIIYAFYQLKVPGSFCGKFENKLRKELQRRIKIPNSTSKFVGSNKEETSKLLTNKEYKEKLAQIKKYYNSYTGEVITSITEEEITKVASCMIKLGYDRKSINQFYMDVEKSLKQPKTDSTTEFIQLYDKLSFYSKDCLELQKLEEEAIAYLMATYGCYPHEYDFWYQAFQNVVFSIRLQMPHNYDYEYACAISYIEQEKQNIKSL